MLKIAAEHQLTPEELTQSACLTADRDLFFEPDGRRAPQDEADRVARANRVCASCDVRPRCLDVAIANNEQHGVWGGLDAAERASLRRKAKRAARAAQTSAPAPEPPAPLPTPASTEEVPMPRKPPAEQSRAIVALYTGAEKLSQSAIAARLNVGVAAVRTALQDADVTIRRAGGYTADQRAKSANVDRDQCVQQAATLYTGAERLTQAQIAQRLGLSTNTVAKMLREADVPMRSTGGRPKAPSAVADEVAARPQPDANAPRGPRPGVTRRRNGSGFLWSCPGHKPIEGDTARTFADAVAALDAHLRHEHPTPEAHA